MSALSHPIHAIGNFVSNLFGHQERKAGKEMQARYNQIIADEAPEWQEALNRYQPIQFNLNKLLQQVGDNPLSDAGYKFRLGQGLASLANMQARDGYLRSDAANNEAQRYAQGLASQEYNNWFNRRMGLLGSLSNLQNIYNNIDRFYQGNKENAMLGGQYARNQGDIGANRSLFRNVGTGIGAAIGAAMGNPGAAASGAAKLATQGYDAGQGMQDYQNLGQGLSGNTPNIPYI